MCFRRAFWLRLPLERLVLHCMSVRVCSYFLRVCVAAETAPPKRSARILRTARARAHRKTSRSAVFYRRIYDFCRIRCPTFME